MKKGLLDIRRLALSIGIVSAIGVFFLGMLGMAGLGTELISLIGNFYIGYTPTLLGSLIGALYGFFDGLIGGALIALIYNKL